jgi:hypothetical protein
MSAAGGARWCFFWPSRHWSSPENSPLLVTARVQLLALGNSPRHLVSTVVSSSLWPHWGLGPPTGSGRIRPIDPQPLGVSSMAHTSLIRWTERSVVVQGQRGGFISTCNRPNATWRPKEISPPPRARVRFYYSPSVNSCQSLDRCCTSRLGIARREDPVPSRSWLAHYRTTARVLIRRVSIRPILLSRRSHCFSAFTPHSSGTDPGSLSLGLAAECLARLGNLSGPRSGRKRIATRPLPARRIFCRRYQTGLQASVWRPSNCFCMSVRLRLLGWIPCSNQAFGAACRTALGATSHWTRLLPGIRGRSHPIGAARRTLHSSRFSPDQIQWEQPHPSDLRGGRGRAQQPWTFAA